MPQCCMHLLAWFLFWVIELVEDTESTVSLHSLIACLYYNTAVYASEFGLSC